MADQSRKVVSLPGCGPLAPDAGVGPVPQLVDALERALVEARRGEIRAVGLALVRSGGVTGTSFALAEDEAVSHPLMAAIAYLQYRYAQHKIETSEDHVFRPDED